MTVDEEDEIPSPLREYISQRLQGQVEDDSGGDSGAANDTLSLEEIMDELPTEEHRYVFRALVQKSGRARRVIHRKVTELDGSPFDDFNPDKPTSERRRVGEILWELQSRDWAYHEGNRWYPRSEKFTNSALAGW